MMKIAVPVWDQRVSPVLDTADRVLIYEVEGSTITPCGEVFLGQSETVERARIISEAADVLVCAALSQPLESCLAGYDVDVRGWLMGDPRGLVEIVAYGNDPGSEWYMPGCGRRRGAGCSQGNRMRKRHGNGRCNGNNKRYKA